MSFEDDRREYDRVSDGAEEVSDSAESEVEAAPMRVSSRAAALEELRRREKESDALARRQNVLLSDGGPASREDVKNLSSFLASAAAASAEETTPGLSSKLGLKETAGAPGSSKDTAADVAAARWDVSSLLQQRRQEESRGRSRRGAVAACDVDDDGSDVDSLEKELFHSGGVVRQLAAARPGCLYLRALADVGRLMQQQGVGSESSGAVPLFGPYLQSVFFSTFPESSLGPRLSGEIRHLGVALDLLGSGSLAALGDLLVQRLKVLQARASDGSWSTAIHHDVGNRQGVSLISDGEATYAAKAELLRLKLEQAKARVASGGAGVGPLLDDAEG